MPSIKINKLFLGLSLIPLIVFANAWEDMKEPSKDNTESIGSYSNGCLLGAEPLKLNGEGYQVIRPKRGRYYANPIMNTYLKQLAYDIKNEFGFNILIGDLSLPKGGPFTSGHRSHQTGLDADIWLRVADKPIKDINSPAAISVVDIDRFKLNKNWNNKHFSLIKKAAENKDVARIFVHPVIKDALCKTESNDKKERAWLNKIRPWWGHNAHMHIRLKCPLGDSECEEQSPPPKGDGCGSELLSWWPENRKKQTKTPKKKVKKELPYRCKAIIVDGH